MAMLRLLALCGALAEALAAETQPDALERVALVEEDECHGSGSDRGSCTLSAVQRSVRRLEDGEGSDQLPLDVPPSEPDTKMYSNVSLQELGLDELHLLMEAARKTVNERLADDPKPYPPVNEPTSEAASTANGCPSRSYSGQRSGDDLCFCQLAGNPGCQGAPCACGQGCGPSVVWSNAETVTFKNRARAVGCSPSTVLLTASRSYYSTTRDLKAICGGGAAGLLRAMLQNSWDWYQSKVGSGPVNQCFHNPRIASVKYLHLQTFCGGGQFHAMPTGNRKNSVGFCVTMSSRGQAGSLASKLAGWL